MAGFVRRIRDWNVAIRPTQDDWFDGKDRRRTSIALNMQVTLPMAIGMLLAGVLALNNSGSVSEYFVSIVLIASSIPGWLVAHWFFPSCKWEIADASQVGEVVWVKENRLLKEANSKAPWLKLTQVSSTFRHNGVHKQFCVGLRTGRGYQFTVDFMIKVYTLHDPLRLFRRSSPQGAPHTTIDPEQVFSILMGIHELASMPQGWVPTSRVREVVDDSYDNEKLFAILHAAKYSGYLNVNLRMRQVHVTGSGQIWLADWARRQHGIEIIRDAQDKAMASNNYYNHGIVQGDNSQAAMASNSGVGNINFSFGGESSKDLQALRELLSIVKNPNIRDGLSVNECANIDEEIPVIEEAIELERPDLHSVRKAVKAIMSVSGQLILGAGGSGLFAALQAIAG